MLSVTAPASPGAGQLHSRSEPDGGGPLGGPLPSVVPPREASESPAGGLVTEVLLMVGDHRPGEFVSEKHETSLCP